MNRGIRRIALLTMVLLLAVVANLTYVQFVQAGSYAQDPRNLRTLLSEYQHPRGSIIAGGEVIASSTPTGDPLKYLRRYADGPVFAPVTGFDSLVYGRTGLEQAESPTLSGTSNDQTVHRIEDLLRGRTERGGNVVTTINPRAQTVAYDELAKQRGAVVALDPNTGAILTMATRPSYDPNQLSSHDPGAIRAAYQALSNQAGEPLLDRAISARYPPGSTFKPVVAAAALATGGYTPQTRIPSPTALSIPQTSHQLHNFAGESCGNGTTDTFIDAMAISCNTAFAGLGLKLGEQAIRAQADKFGIGKSLQIPLPVAPSTLGPIPDPPALALSSIGQDNVALTPMQGAMIAAAIADKGTLMSPYLVAQTQAPDLTVVSKHHPTRLGQVTTPKVAAELTTMLEAVISRGTGTPAQIPGVRVAGKTGTADNAPGAAPHAWFIGFAPADHPKVAVAVFLQNGGVNGNEATGGLAAAPIARDVMKAVLAGGGTR